MIGLFLVVLGIFILLPGCPIPGLMNVQASIKGIVKINGPAGFVLIILGVMLETAGI